MACGGQAALRVALKRRKVLVVAPGLPEPEQLPAAFVANLYHACHDS